MATSKVEKVEKVEEVKEVKKTVAKKEAVVKTASLSVAMFDIKGVKAGTATLPKEIFGAKVNSALIAQAVRVYLANQRQGNANTKSRNEITLTTAKWYRQKGTGRARHGAQSAPIFVGGGVAHGPKAHDFSLSMPKKMKKAALISALSQRAIDGDIKVLSGLSKITPKTKEMSVLFGKVIENKKSNVLLVTSAPSKELDNVYKAGRNIKNVKIINAKLLNAYEVLKYKNLVFMKESIEVLTSQSGEKRSAE